MSDEFTAQYDLVMQLLLASPPEGVDVRYIMFKDNGGHPEDYMDYECLFASLSIAQHHPSRILDIGSYRYFVLGLLAAYDVLSVDIRTKTILPEKNKIISDVRNMGDIGLFDAIVSLCSLEHVGLGRYGDEIDLDGDKQAFMEVKKRLNPGGILVFSVPITKGKTTIVFNAHRIYNYEMITDLCKGLVLVNESVFSLDLCQEIPLERVTMVPGNYDIYCGCWRKGD